MTKTEKIKEIDYFIYSLSKIKFCLNNEEEMQIGELLDKYSLIEILKGITKGFRMFDTAKQVLFNLEIILKEWIIYETRRN